jgi:hypothetical protein
MGEILTKWSCLTYNRTLVVIGMIFAASIIKLGIYFESFASCPLVEKSVFGLFSPSTYRIGQKIFSDGHRLHHFERKCTLTPNPKIGFDSHQSAWIIPAVKPLE